MKTNFLFLVSMFIICTVYGEIKNGYENQISSARESLKNLSALRWTSHDLSHIQLREIKSKTQTIWNYIAQYELTENLLKQFRIIAPDLYQEINEIKDSQGRSTDVYVKFILREDASIQAGGITYLDQVEGDQHAYRSEYGERTVSVKIWIMDNALFVLAHEMGHIKYQVPNLAGYMDYYKMTYRPGFTEPNYIGHNTNDPSGLSALSFHKRFCHAYSNSSKQRNNPQETPANLFRHIRKRILSEILAENRLANL